MIAMWIIMDAPPVLIEKLLDYNGWFEEIRGGYPVYIAQLSGVTIEMARGEGLFVCGRGKYRLALHDKWDELVSHAQTCAKKKILKKNLGGDVKNRNHLTHNILRCLALDSAALRRVCQVRDPCPSLWPSEPRTPRFQPARPARTGA